MSERNSDARRRQEPLIDCDVHNALPDGDALRPYLPAVWRDRREGLTYLPTEFRQVRENLGDRSYIGAEYPRPTPRASRVDSWPPGGGPPASDLAFTQQQLLDAWDVEAAILNPLLGIGEMLNLELAGVMARASNDWLAAEWLDRDRACAPRSSSPTRTGPPRPRRSTGSHPTPLRAGADALPHDRADRAPPVLADLRGLRTARAADRHTQRRLGRSSDHARRLPVVLRRGCRRDGRRVSSAGRKPALRGRA